VLRKGDIELKGTSKVGRASTGGPSFANRSTSRMKLIAYVLDGHEIEIRPAPVERDWMDASDRRFAYRCLPLNIANAHGWEILCASAFDAVWNGGASRDSVRVRPSYHTLPPAISHFGEGTLTFHVPCLFRTEPGFDLVVAGPINRPKDAIAPLSGIVETDWAPFTFTMNWKFTRKDTPVRFERGEPFCHIFPINRGDIEQIEPELRLLSEAPELRRQFEQWTQTRGEFITDLNKPGSPAQAEGWQKHYYRGLDADAQPGGEHRTRLRLPPFKR
jgi:Family of unknown function (DUF6065)